MSTAERITGTQDPSGNVHAQSVWRHERRSRSSQKTSGRICTGAWHEPSRSMHLTPLTFDMCALMVPVCRLRGEVAAINSIFDDPSEVAAAESMQQAMVELLDSEEEQVLVRYRGIFVTLIRHPQDGSE